MIGALTCISNQMHLEPSRLFLNGEIHFLHIILVACIRKCSLNIKRYICIFVHMNGPTC